MTKGLQIERKVGMYGDCLTINAYNGHDTFGGATYEPLSKTWIMSLHAPDGACSDFDVISDGNHEASMQEVERIIARFFQQHYMAPQKVPARYLTKGDLTGSGETIVNVAAGIHTPQGRVEVTLEKDGHRRLALWRASTVINVRRAA